MFAEADADGRESTAGRMLRSGIFEMCGFAFTCARFPFTCYLCAIDIYQRRTPLSILFLYSFDINQRRTPYTNEGRSWLLHNKIDSVALAPHSPEWRHPPWLADLPWRHQTLLLQCWRPST